MLGCTSVPFPTVGLENSCSSVIYMLNIKLKIAANIMTKTATRQRSQMNTLCVDCLSSIKSFTIVIKLYKSKVHSYGAKLAAFPPFLC